MNRQTKDSETSREDVLVDHRDLDRLARLLARLIDRLLDDEVLVAEPLDDLSRGGLVDG